MASTVGSEADTGATGPQKQTIGQRLGEFATFVWNPETSECLGRTGLSWAKIILFYVIYYICLAGFWIAMIAVFYQTIDWDYPRLSGEDSLLRDNPGLGFRPLPDVKTTLIRFIKGKPSTYKPYTDHIEAFLKFYENAGQVGENVMDCSSIPNYREKKDWNKVCKFDLSRDLGQGNPCIKQDDFGYDDGQPCVLIKLNKIYNWMPQKYENGSIPGEVGGGYMDNAVNIRCTGENPSDQENIGNVAYYPPEGFHFKYFPFLNQQGYRQPIMFAQFTNVTNGVVIMVRCRAFAKNIAYDTNERAGSVHFELMVD